MIVQCPAPPIQNEKLLILAKISWKPELNFSLNSETVPYFTWKLELFPNTLWMMVGRAKVSAGFTWKYYVFILETRFWIWCSGVLHIPLPTYSFVHLKFWENLSWRGIFSERIIKSFLCFWLESSCFYANHDIISLSWH